MDPGVKNISKEALALITKATELFIEVASSNSARLASSRGTKSIKEIDFLEYVNTNSQAEFLKLDFPRKVVNISSKPIVGQKRVEVEIDKTNALTNFFSVKRNEPE